MAEVFQLRSNTLHLDSIRGYADRFMSLCISESSLENVVQLVTSQTRDEGLPLPSTRGVRNIFKLIADYVNQRQLRQDLGVHTISVTWFELHVPHECKAVLKWGPESSFTLSLLGSGYGNGCKISFSVEGNMPAQIKCCKFIQHIDAHVKVYALPSTNGERYEAAVDLVHPGARQIVAWTDCPFCGIDIDKVDDVEYCHGKLIDLRNYDTTYIESFSGGLTVSNTMDISLPLQALVGIVEGAKIGVTMKREAKINYNLEYEFINGLCYQPYWPADDPNRLPYWSIK
jgi:hypothetical protein